MENQMNGVDLERRLTDLEARLEILQVVAAYGPAIDAAVAEQVLDLFAEDGRYSYTLGEGQAVLNGHADLAGMVHGPMHQGIVAGGSGHVMGLPKVVVDGDRAVATGYSLLTRHDAETGRWYVDRLAANRWELIRTDAGWKVQDRVNLLLDGRSDARELLADAYRLTRPVPVGPDEKTTD